MKNELAIKYRLMVGGRKARVLIIDDDVEFQELLRIHLSLSGFEPEVAVDAVEAGKALLARPPDLVLCDINMPFMSGFDLLSQMRANQGTASIPVILLSGNSDEETVAKAVSLGAADYLTKPVMLEDLLKSIHTCLVPKAT